LNNDQQLGIPTEKRSCYRSKDITKPLELRIAGVENYLGDSNALYEVEVCLTHGIDIIAQNVVQLKQNYQSGWISLQVLICNIPRESRISFTFYKCNAFSGERISIEGYVNINVFHSDGTLLHKGYLLPLWPDKPTFALSRLGPNTDHRAAALRVEFENPPYPIVFQPIRISTTLDPPINPSSEALKILDGLLNSGLFQISQNLSLL
jgi:hypothetical protein